MERKITISIDEDMYEKFCIAVDLSKDTEEKAIETSLRWYIANAFKSTYQEYNPNIAKKSANEGNNYFGKAIQRIPVWALKPNQYNHKILRAYFKAIEIEGNATITMMENLCSDKEYQELFVPTFKNNYSQMKIDGPKSHGKVFEDDGENVWIWSEVEEILLKNKSNFWNEGE